MSVLRLIPKRFEGRHVLYVLVGFFGVMFLANGVFVYFAVGTFNGFETSDAYREGLNYNARIASAEAQQARGWQALARYDNSRSRLVLDVRDDRSRLVAGLSVSGEIRRPVNDREDRQLVLVEAMPGRYEAPLELAPGQWVLSAEITEAGNSAAVHRLRQRLWVKEEP